MNINMTAPEGVTEVDVLAERYRTAFNKLSKDLRPQWIEATLELVMVVKDVRQRYPDHREYHRWLVRNDLREISNQDLSAFNQFACDLTQARQLLEQSTSWSWQRVWQERPNRPAKVTLSKSRKGPLSARTGAAHRNGANKSIPDRDAGMICMSRGRYRA